MRAILNPIVRLFRLIMRMAKSKWGRFFLIIGGFAAIFAAIWFGFPLTGYAPISTVVARGVAIAGLIGLIALIYLLRWRSRRKKARKLEQSLLPDTTGDGKVLAKNMKLALDKLKRSGGKNYLYDLPWYVIIGPPGAGKTTALRNSGIEFPGLDAMPEHGAGFGGTRNCDWWFAEEAVLIDTAGRYTTQDSDAAADEASWGSFLELLKNGRPDQPINGVILAFSVEQMLNAAPEDIAAHAQIVRKRLGEIHEQLKIDFPVYVLFTKADLIAGFREYFASFSTMRRKNVWGVTFQTKDRKADTYLNVEAEFDALLGRLSDEVIDRMNEEPDGVSRIAVFGLPGQMAMMRHNVSEFIRQVFEPTRYKTNAILRGFYFSSGTQEGTPIDQVLGAMSRNQEGVEFQPAFMSGKGKSFFLHDLLKRVIFEERDWVSFDYKAIRRARILRTGAMGLIVGATMAAMGAFGFSFWQNATLLRTADIEAQRYFSNARGEISRPVVDNTDPSLVLLYLEDLRNMTAGYGDTRKPPLWEGLGLSRHSEVSLAADRAYSDGLERMLRPRMILHLENRIPQLIADNQTAETYRALKVYLLLGGQGEGSSDDAAIEAYFEDLWARMFAGVGQADERDRINAHLKAMLLLDNDRQAMLAIDPEIVRSAREAIVNLPLADQAYASIKDRAVTYGVPDFNLVERVSGAVERVFETTDGSALDSVGVPGMYTFEGYWGFFLEELTSARDRLRDDQWVLGEAAGRVGYEAQLSNLERDLHRAYRIEFNEAWREMFGRIGLGPLSIDAPAYDALAILSSPVASPLLEYVEAVEEETRLTRLYDQIGELSPEQLASGGLSDGMGDAVFRRIYSQSGVFQRVVLDNVAKKGKVQTRAGNAVQEDTQRRQVERITDDFAQWHALLTGEAPERPIDVILANLADLRENRRTAAVAPTPADETLLSQSLSALTRNNTALPGPLSAMVNEVETEFRAVATAASMTQLNRALNDDVTQFCRDLIAPLYPFGTGRHLSPAVFGQFFGPGGRIDTFYTSYLQPHVIRGNDGLQPAPDSAIGQSLSIATLKQFDRAQAIQLAFFATGSAEPKVDMSISHLSSSPSVELAILSMNGASVRTQPDSIPAALSWPGQSSGVALELFPAADDRTSSLTFAEGRWDIVNFLRKGRSRVSNNVVDVTHDVGGRTITYRIEFNSTTVPFLMRELSEFSCPVTLER
ncbi:type VI secretion system membrane subunit TssM [Sulfitobacter sp. F26204]|uniref:type VI secretion system membrane subunit TssM n=1 Tax=Sulfitobacter sp. F26204 TaxID=2996014 RepID=UPI00225DD55B|nr:type VI secretion system membrane subunit TssM [Sulfitobacter sp. F26204]MCX7561651.1 type VI secretion system membrane subunit TssM [Sulfitobacter sp. F26204]